MITFLKHIFKRKSPADAQKEYLIRNGMKIGRNTSIFSWEGIDAGKPWLIEIGNDVTISSNVTILTHDASPCKVGCGTKLGKVIIGNNVFIGTRAVILCNVRVGDNVIIGAGSVVSHDLQSNGVYAGVPAKLICSFEEYSAKMRKLHEQRPNLGSIKPWEEWYQANEKEKKLMYDALEDGIGFF